MARWDVDDQPRYLATYHGFQVIAYRVYVPVAYVCIVLNLGPEDPDKLT